jgi:hypothetical protein
MVGLKSEYINVDDVEGNSRDLISVTLLRFVSRVERERELTKEFSVSGPRFRELPNMNQECSPLARDVWSFV